MKTGTHSCSCGSRFGLRVELAVHCELTAHQPVRDELPAVVVVCEEPPVVATRKPRKPLGRTGRALVAAALLLSFLGFNAAMQKAVATCTCLQTTLATQLVSP